MAAYFLDSSSLVKRFASEKGTGWLVKLFRQKPEITIFAARITFVEVSSALARKVRSGEIKADSEEGSARRLHRAFDHRISTLEINKALILDSAQLARKHLLRGYDAIQLAAALEISYERASRGLSQVIFVSGDNDLNQAAASEGLAIENPNDHP